MALTPIGITSYTLAGPPRWSIDADGFDTVTLPYRGRYDLLSAFLSSHAKYEACPLDGNLFLDNISNDDAKVQPTVDLRYKGFRNGVIPQGEHGTDKSLQTITYEVGIEDVASVSIEVQYLAPTTNYTWISTVSEGGGSASNPTGTPQIIFWRVGVLTSNQSGGLTTAQIQSFINNNFFTRILPHISSKEIVPNRYYQNTQTKTLIYYR